jgi:subtilisin-like proprotein convertase family protein
VEKSSITVPDNLTLAQLSVQVNITEPADSNLYVYLVGPDGTKVTLLNPGSVSAGGSGATGSNFTNTTFSDTASSTISGGKGPYSGVYKPYQALSAFKGKSGKGTWTLYIVDEVAGGGNGKLNSWSLLETPSSL